jgi:cytochrome P450
MPARNMVSFNIDIKGEAHISHPGPIIRLGPNDLMTTSPDILTRMSAVRSPYTRAEWYYGASRVESGKDHVFSQIDEAKHTKRRHQMAAGVRPRSSPSCPSYLTSLYQYSGKENTLLESSIDKHVQELLNLIRSKYLSTNGQAVPMDLARKIQFFTLDVISSIGFGQPFGDLNSDSDIDSYIHSGEQALGFATFSTAFGLTPMLHWPWLARLLGPSEKDKTGFGKMMATARRLIDSRLAQPNGNSEGSDMLASFLRHGLSRDDLFTESILQILAGSDTTATAIRCTMLYIISNPRVYAKLQAEVDGYVASGGVMKIVSDVEAKKLRYLMAVIYEGLRIHPPVTDEVPKVVPKGGDTIIVEGKEVFLPGGTNIGYCVLGLNRNSEVFGEDVEQFRPERWLIEDEERLNTMKRTTDLIFGYGKYQCLGKPIAWLEFSKVIFEVR